MIKSSISIVILVITFAHCQEINEVPEPPAELKSIPPPPKAEENKVINSDEERSINETEKPSAVQGKIDFLCSKCHLNNIECYEIL